MRSCAKVRHHLLSTTHRRVLSGLDCEAICTLIVCFAESNAALWISPSGRTERSCVVLACNPWPTRSSASGGKNIVVSTLIFSPERVVEIEMLYSRYLYCCTCHPIQSGANDGGANDGGANAGRTHLSKSPIVQQPMGLWPMSAKADILCNKLFDLNVDLVARIDRGLEAGIFLWRRIVSRRTSVDSGLLPKNRPQGIVENPTRSMRLRTKLTPFFVRLQRTADCLARCPSIVAFAESKAANRRTVPNQSRRAAVPRRRRLRLDLGRDCVPQRADNQGLLPGCRG
jgi:hypothetical protein